MAFERFWKRQNPIAFTADGGEDGLVTVASVECLKVKQEVKISAVGLPDKVLEVKKVISPTQLYVGPRQNKTQKGNRSLLTREDISAYTTALSATISSQEQSKQRIKPEDIINATYEQEPTVAWRVHSVDKWGREWDVDNPFPVRLSQGSVNIDTINADLSVQLTHFDKPDGTPGDSVKIGDGSNEVGVDTTTGQNRLKVHNTDFLTEVSKNNVTGHKDFSVAGFVEDVSIAGKTVWSGPGFYIFPTTSETLEVFSSSPNDNPAGIGAIAVNIQGLDINYQEINETVVLNGTSIVTTTIPFFRINTVVVVSAGSSETNQGEITLRQSTSGIILSIIIPAASISNQAIKTVPVGKKALLYDSFALNSKNGLEVKLRNRDGNLGVRFSGFQLEVGNTVFDSTLSVPIVFLEKNDIWVDVFTKSGVTTVTTFLNMVLVDS